MPFRLAGGGRFRPRPRLLAILGVATRPRSESDAYSRHSPEYRSEFLLQADGGTQTTPRDSPRRSGKCQKWQVRIISSYPRGTMFPTASDDLRTNSAWVPHNPWRYTCGPHKQNDKSISGRLDHFALGATSSVFLSSTV